MDTSNQPSILWHDYETWGASPKHDHPSQFAAIRTDLDLNPIGDPANFYCYPPADYLPNPEACLITGITPQLTFAKGTNQHLFMQKVMKQMLQANTCSAGYNTLRFDDEVTRYSAYRNLMEPYAREWKNGNSRWDIIDMVRACFALRPEGIEWPEREDGAPSFKLELLSQANGLEHANAHDALSDVWATIGMAKLIKTKQPKLYQYLWELRDKRKVAELIDEQNLVPLVHTSSKISAFQGCTTWIVPVAWHPVNKNAFIALNLALDPEPLLNMTTDDIANLLFSKEEDLMEGESRLPIKLIHTNKCPVLAPAKTLTEENAERLGIDRATCLKNLAFIKQHQQQISQSLIDFYTQQEFEEEKDVDHMLYSGFFNQSDVQLMNQLHQMPIEQLVNSSPAFSDNRLQQLWFRFKARNYPESLAAQELTKWQLHCQEKLTGNSNKGCLNAQEFVTDLENLTRNGKLSDEKMAILKALYDYVSQM
ncbi:exodeoxyribonuclease I [Catenovulum sp. SM1970]|uniref:exodeoxyribonuclease I n=1 Tax=Marinifaba aquimaris TaxID=2741323 RepID=UPI0015738325|nr:exodeoxyribonuclease I [Marinifaba aquimaris]NTS78564.1 exodeoxyribonuclease I [Marinifaba aquimaris]